MEVQYGPNSVDEPNLLYKLQHKIKVFNTSATLPNRGYNLVASSSKYGLVFVAVPEGILTVYQLSQLIDPECEPQHLTLQLQEKPTHVAVSCDYELLVVTGGQLLSIYQIAEFQNSNLSPSVSIRTEVNPSTYVSSLQWNPCIPDSIAIAYNDCTLLACIVSNGQMKKVTSRARCICWSPKGKQLVTGNSDGTLIQYKPDLTAAKIVPAPNLFEGSPVEAMAIYWISTFQFAVVYKNAADNSRPAVTIVNTPKGGQPSCTNYEDICYSMGSNRPWYYYLLGLAQWNIILTSSSNSMEIGTLGSPDGVNWVQWCQIDEARPELPLTDKKVENYPVGICIDTSAIHRLPWGENESLPHMPLLHVLSQNGLLTIFNIINLSKDAKQVCSPPQNLTLPAHEVSSAIPGETHIEPAPTPATAEPVSVLQSALQSATPTPQLASQFGSTMTDTAIMMSSFTPHTGLAFSTEPATQAPEQKPIPEIKPSPQDLIPAADTKPQSASQQTQENTALKAEQEKVNKMKANQELKNMLVKEVNDFQMELYNFMVKTRETQVKLQHDIETISTNFNGISIDTEQLKKECSIEELRGAIVQLKLELVRACAVVAEARTHSDAKDLPQWTQSDPLTTKRVASVKKLAYYVQNQLEQAHRALDYKWNEFASTDPQFNKPGKRMIRPILDDVYQPLVKQQEILSRQQAVLRTLKNALNECDIGPVFKSTSLLRSTPFKNNKDPLSKLTKNILNMSIEQETKTKRSLLTAQKLDALRDVLSNHKTIKIKPVNVQLTQHLETMRKNYENSLIEVKPPVQPATPPMVKIEPKSEPLQPTVSAPAFPPLKILKYPAGFTNTSLTLFSVEQPKSQLQIQNPVSQQIGLSTPTTVAEPSAIDTKNILKDLLTNKQANLETKNNSNTFMGQKICTPSAFAPSSTSAPAPSNVFTSKPIAGINNMFSKFQPQPVVSETESILNVKPTIPSMPNVPNVKSSETGEPEETAKVAKPFNFKDKPITNLFAMKTTPSAASTPITSDVSKTSIQDQKVESTITVKPLDTLVEKTKEDIPEKDSENIPKPEQKEAEKTQAVNLLSSPPANKSFDFSKTQPIETASVAVAPNDPKPLDLKAERKTETPKVIEKSDATSTSASSIFTTVNVSITVPKPQSVLSSLSTTAKTETPTTESSGTDSKSADSATPTPSSSASSIFGAAVASQPKTTNSIFSSSPTSVFSSTGSSPTSVFGTTNTSIFSSSKPSFDTATTSSSVFSQTNTTQSVFGSTAASVFASASTSQPASPTVTPLAFGAATTTSASVFGTSPASATSAFGSTTTASVFGATTTPTPAFNTTASSTFGTSTPSVSVSSVFEVTTTASDTSAFETTTTTQASIFGSAEATPSAFTPATTSIFGTATTQALPFGQAAQSVFGATTQASIFGGASSQSSVFGSPTTQTSMFGSPTPTTQASVSGSPAQSTQASIFGTPTATTQISVFGTPTQVNQVSVFGTPTQTTQASVFGTPTQATQVSVFGQPATTTQSGSLFGEGNLFAAASISTTSSSTPGSGGNIFGGSSSSSIFGGGNTNVFGGKSAFGQPNQATTNIFGGGTSFGQKPATNIWGSGNTTGSGFGTSGFAQPVTTQASIFGGSTGGSFSQPSAGAFGSPQQPSAFGSPPQPQQQQAPAFGGSPVFGSKPLFGQPSGFSSSAGFGAPASFGGFSKSPGSSGFGAPAFGGSTGFGGSPPGNGFGSPTQSNATFESLATQNTLTFGNLAQQSGSPQQAAPSFNASPSFTGWRG